jgi:hypothetical protein
MDPAALQLGVLGQIRQFPDTKRMMEELKVGRGGQTDENSFDHFVQGGGREDNGQRFID